MRSLRPIGSDHTLSANALTEPGTQFPAATVGGRAVGCAAQVPRGDSGELKSMFVAPEAYGTGLGARLLAAVETRARAEGVRHLMLETGASLEAARRLYTRASHRERGPFGAYGPDPLSASKERDLGEGGPV